MDTETTNNTYFNFFLNPKGTMEKDDYITGNMLIFGFIFVIFLLRNYLPPINHSIILIVSIFLYYITIAMGLKRIRDANLPLWFIAFFIPIRVMSIPSIVVFLCIYNRRKKKKIS